MKSALLVAATLATLSSFPVIAQQTPDQAPQQQTAPAPAADSTSTPPSAPDAQQTPPADTQQAPSKPAADSTSDQTGQAGQASPAANDSAAAAVEMSPVKGELVGKLDTASAKTGDSVVLKTKENVKTADGTEIPKGSKLVGHVTQVQPHGEGKSNSQIALQFDHAELKGGQNVAIQSAIQSVAPSSDSSTGSAGGTASPMPSNPGGAPSGGASGANGSMPNSRSTEPATANSGSYQQGASGSSASSTTSNGMTAGTVVQRNGNIAISTTAIPGVLLANNAPGQHDPRMASASGILLGAGRDVHLDGGTQMVVAVAAAPAAAGTAGGSSNR
jgi:hypothetical protein